MISIESPRRRAGLILTVALVLLAVSAGATPPASAQATGGAGDPEIVGGVPVGDATDFPYQVALVFRQVSDPFQAQFCGGSLISPDTVLTAAHCVEGESARDLAVRSGIVDLVDDLGHRANVRQIRVHPDYDPATSDNDVAVLQLSTTLPEPVVEIARPSQAGLWPAGTPATITGWGDLTGDSEFPTTMHVAEVPVVSDADCASAYPGAFVAPHMRRAGSLTAGGAAARQLPGHDHALALVELLRQDIGGDGNHVGPFGDGGCPLLRYTRN